MSSAALGPGIPDPAPEPAAASPGSELERLLAEYEAGQVEAEATQREQEQMRIEAARATAELAAAQKYREQFESTAASLRAAQDAAESRRQAEHQTALAKVEADNKLRHDIDAAAAAVRNLDLAPPNVDLPTSYEVINNMSDREFKAYLARAAAMQQGR
jgi:hypothetical protein